MMNRHDYYRLLHVQQDAPTEVIRASYRTLMQKLRQHPDLGGDDSNAAFLNEAYAVLCDCEKRAQYDRELGRVREGGGGQPQASPSPSTSVADPTGRINCSFCNTSNRCADENQSTDECRRCGSPLQPVTQWALQSASKRAVERIQHSARMVFFERWPQPSGVEGVVEDLSPMGMRFRSERPVEVDTVIKIDMESLFATARVVKCTGQGLGVRNTIGVEFLTIEFRAKRGTFISRMA
jgi:hypothetical protein